MWQPYHDSIIGNQDVLFYWSIAAAQFDEKEAELLLEQITDLWITVKGFAYTSGLLEQYKQKEKIEYKRANHFVLECSVVQKTHDYIIMCIHVTTFIQILSITTIHCF